MEVLFFSIFFSWHARKELSNPSSINRLYTLANNADIRLKYLIGPKPQLHHTETIVIPHDFAPKVLFLDTIVELSFECKLILHCDGSSMCIWHMEERCSIYLENNEKSGAMLKYLKVWHVHLVNKSNDARHNVDWFKTVHPKFHATRMYHVKIFFY